MALADSWMDVRKEKPKQMQRELQCNANVIFEGCALSISQHDQKNRQTPFFPKPHFTRSNQRHGWGWTAGNLPRTKTRGRPGFPLANNIVGILHQRPMLYTVVRIGAVRTGWKAVSSQERERAQGAGRCRGIRNFEPHLV